jgi:hypothetical protein
MNAMWFPTKLAKYVLSEPVDDRQRAAAEPETFGAQGIVEREARVGPSLQGTPLVGAVHGEIR